MNWFKNKMSKMLRFYHVDQYKNEIFLQVFNFRVVQKSLPIRNWPGNLHSFFQIMKEQKLIHQILRRTKHKERLQNHSPIKGTTNLTKDISSPILTFCKQVDMIILNVGMLYCGHLKKEILVQHMGWEAMIFSQQTA